MNGDCPAVIAEQADHHPHKSRLAGAVGSEHPEYLPFRHGKREAVQYLDCAVAEREVTSFDYGGGLRHGSVDALLNVPQKWRAHWVERYHSSFPCARTAN